MQLLKYCKGYCHCEGKKRVYFFKKRKTENKTADNNLSCDYFTVEMKRPYSQIMLNI